LRQRLFFKRTHGTYSRPEKGHGDMSFHKKGTGGSGDRWEEEFSARGADHPVPGTARGRAFQKKERKGARILTCKRLGSTGPEATQKNLKKKGLTRREGGKGGKTGVMFATTGDHTKFSAIKGVLRGPKETEGEMSSLH